MVLLAGVVFLEIMKSLLADTTILTLELPKRLLAETLDRTAFPLVLVTTKNLSVVPTVFTDGRSVVTLTVELAIQTSFILLFSLFAS